MKCYNCEKNAIWAVGPEGKEIPLCLNCYEKFQSVHAKQTAEYERQINQLSREIEFISGVPGVLPRYPERQVVQTGDIMFNNIKVSDSQIGVLNTGTIGTVDASVTVMQESGNRELAEAVTELSKAVISSTELTNETKNEILELLSVVSSEAVTPEKRRRRAVISPLITALSAVLSKVGTLTDIWEKVKTLFEQFFGV